MSKQFKPAQAFDEGERPNIPLTAVEGDQVGAVGYCPETKTLAVQFKHGAAAIYHYGAVKPETHAAFMAAESKGKFHSQHIKDLPFRKYRAPVLQPATA